MFFNHHERLQYANHTFRYRLHAYVLLAEALLPDDRPQITQEPQAPLPRTSDLLAENHRADDQTLHQLQVQQEDSLHQQSRGVDGVGASGAGQHPGESQEVR